MTLEAGGKLQETQEEKCKLCIVLVFCSLKHFDFIFFCFSPGMG